MVRLIPGDNGWTEDWKLPEREISPEERDALVARIAELAKAGTGLEEAVRQAAQEILTEAHEEAHNESPLDYYAFGPDEDLEEVVRMIREAQRKYDEAKK